MPIETGKPVYKAVSKTYNECTHFCSKGQFIGNAKGGDGLICYDKVTNVGVNPVKTKMWKDVEDGDGSIGKPKNNWYTFVVEKTAADNGYNTDLYVSRDITIKRWVKREDAAFRKRHSDLSYEKATQSIETTVARLLSNN